MTLKNCLRAVSKAVLFRPFSVRLRTTKRGWLERSHEVKDHSEIEKKQMHTWGFVRRDIRGARRDMRGYGKTNWPGRTVFCMVGETEHIHFTTRYTSNATHDMYVRTYVRMRACAYIYIHMYVRELCTRAVFGENSARRKCTRRARSIAHAAGSTT